MSYILFPAVPVSLRDVGPAMAPLLAFQSPMPPPTSPTLAPEPERPGAGAPLFGFVKSRRVAALVLPRGRAKLRLNGWRGWSDPARPSRAGVQLLGAEGLPLGI